MPLKFRRAKTSKIWRDFGQLQTLIANISGTDSDIENRENRLSTRTPPMLGDKDLVHFGPATEQF